MTVRNEIKAQIVRAGYTMQELVDRLHEEYGWSDSVSNLSAKLNNRHGNMSPTTDHDFLLSTYNFTKYFFAINKRYTIYFYLLYLLVMLF